MSEHDREPESEGHDERSHAELRPADHGHAALQPTEHGAELQREAVAGDE
jgi:hypothetical protein